MQWASSIARSERSTLSRVSRKPSKASRSGARVDDLVGASTEPREPPGVLLAGEARGQERRGDPAHRERPHLIFHERDEGREDERGAGERDRGELVTERFAAAGGRDEEHAAALIEERERGLALPVIKPLEAEMPDNERGEPIRLGRGRGSDGHGDERL